MNSLHLSVFSFQCIMLTTFLREFTNVNLIPVKIPSNKTGLHDNYTEMLSCLFCNALFTLMVRMEIFKKYFENFYLLTKITHNFFELF